MEFSKELEEFKFQIDKIMEKKMDESIAEAAEDDEIVADMLRYFKKTLLVAGKRVRPCMMYYGYLAAGGTDKKKIMDTAICVELIHSFLVMHDDIVDRDDIRHGMKTIHAHYRDYANKNYKTKDSKHFGVSVGIIMGDTIYSIANQVLFSSKFEAGLIIKAMNKLQEIVRYTALGEMQDIIMGYKKKATEKEILKMYENKTAKYTFEGPFQLGALLAGITSEKAKKISEFAVPLGIAFQLQDDFLGVFGNEKKTGKPFASDIIEGKQTLLVTRAVSLAPHNDKNKIKKLLGKKDISKIEIDEFVSILNSSGAVKSIAKDTEEYLNKATSIINMSEIPRDIKNFLLGMILYLKKREF